MNVIFMIRIYGGNNPLLIQVLKLKQGVNYTYYPFFHAGILNPNYAANVWPLKAANGKPWQSTVNAFFVAF
jgi:hypothetical protein